MSSTVRKIDKLEQKIKKQDDILAVLKHTVKEHDDNLHRCFDLIEGIHVLLDQETGTNLTYLSPPNIRGKSRERGKSRKKGRPTRTRKVSRRR